MLYLLLQTMVKALTGLLALFALVAAGALFLRKARESALAHLPRGVLVALLVCAVVATDWAQKGTSRAPARSPRNVPMVLPDGGERSSWGTTNLRFTAIGVSSNSVWMSLAWPGGFLAGGDRLDVFSASSLPSPDDLLPADDVSGLGWRWRAGHIVVDGSTNVTLSVDVAEEGERPSAQFFRAVVSPLPPVSDADGDGLADVVDPEPQIAGADAHGANAEWYGVVCPNVFMKASPGEPTGSAVTLPNGETVHFRPDVNERAYYFVEVVAKRGPAEVRFQTDTPGRLGSPVVLARTGETCLVPLLIGAEYAVTSAVPISLCAPDAAYAEIVTNDTAGHTVKWPLEFVDVEDSPGVHVMDVRPYDPGGTFAWSRGAVGARHAVSASSGGGCPYTALASTVEFGCNGSDGCTCGGCIVHATYGLEGNTFYGGSVACGCTPRDDPPPPPEDPEPQIPYISPHVDVWFSQSAVIFEDDYQNEVGGEIIPRRSTVTCLCVYAEAGSENAEFVFDSLNLDKLDLVDGEDVLPSAMTLGPGGVYYAEFVYKGAEASDYEGDVFVDAYIENESGDFYEWADSMTVVEVEVNARIDPPDRAMTSKRHLYGVCEEVEIVQNPPSPRVTWIPTGGGSNIVTGANLHYFCPLFGCDRPLHAELDGIDFTPDISVIEPQKVKATPRFGVNRASVLTFGAQKGEAGGIGMQLTLTVHPLYVSFSNLKIEEVPCYSSRVSGYFSNPYYHGAFFHTVNAGAGTWNKVNEDNEFAWDQAAFWDTIPWLTPLGLVTTDPAYAWTGGYVYMSNPFGWSSLDAHNGDAPYRQFASDAEDEFMLDANGTVGVRKLANQITRTTNDVIRLNGRLIP